MYRLVASRRPFRRVQTPPTEEKRWPERNEKKEKVSTGWPRTMPLVVVDHLLHVVKRPTVVTGVRDRLPLQQATGVT